MDIFIGKIIILYTGSEKNNIHPSLIISLYYNNLSLTKEV